MRIHGNIPMPPVRLISQNFQEVLANAEELRIQMQQRIAVCFVAQFNCYLPQPLNAVQQGNQIVSVTI
jgi:hypothetical protein